MAEALLNGKNSHAYRARSAGFAPMEAVDPEVRFMLESAGYETGKLHPKSWEDFYRHASIVKVDVIVTLSEEARELCPMEWPGDPVRVHWNVDDPLGAPRVDMREWKLRKCLATLETRISMLLRCRPDVSSVEMLLRLKEIGMAV